VGAPSLLLLLWRRAVRSRTAARASSAWIKDGGGMESGAMGCALESGLGAMGWNSTRATNSGHWNWIEFQISIPLWAKRVQLQNPIDFSPIRGNQTGPHSFLSIFFLSPFLLWHMHCFFLHIKSSKYILSFKPVTARCTLAHSCSAFSKREQAMVEAHV
jgi:hypothetical protein